MWRLDSVSHKTVAPFVLSISRPSIGLKGQPMTLQDSPQRVDYEDVLDIIKRVTSENKKTHILLKILVVSYC